MANYSPLLCGLYLLFTCHHVFANPWALVNKPFDGKSSSIGTYANGCLSGGVPLASSGEGYQVIRTSLNRFYGHNTLVQFIKDYAANIKRADIDDILIGDMSMPRGGHFASGHTSHQIGLDVDIWLRQVHGPLSRQWRDKPQKLDVVDHKGFKVNDNWSSVHVKMIQLVVSDARVARIFVHPAIKQQLCDQVNQERAWLQKVRPWWGHSSHMHVRLKCPGGDKFCQDQVKPPKGDGCDELSWWRAQMTAPKNTQKSDVDTKPKPKKVKPEQCRTLL